MCVSAVLFVLSTDLSLSLCLSAVLPSVSQNDSSLPNSTRWFLFHPAKAQNSMALERTMLTLVGMSQR